MSGRSSRAAIARDLTVTNTDIGTARRRPAATKAPAIGDRLSTFRLRFWHATTIG
ncbi:MAG: hypothetical protein WAV38_32990 [Xanthobacteraceae bacterium]